MFVSVCMCVYVCVRVCENEDVMCIIDYDIILSSRSIDYRPKCPFPNEKFFSTAIRSYMYMSVCTVEQS